MSKNNLKPTKIPKNLKNRVYFDLVYGYFGYFQRFQGILFIFEISMVFWSF